MSKNTLLVIHMVFVLLAVQLAGNHCFASVTGSVRDITGIPVEGALITFTDESNIENISSALTDKNGNYEVFFVL